MDRPLTIATGQALALIAVLLERCGVATAEELSGSLALLAAADDEAASEEAKILRLWAALVGESRRAADAGEPAGAAATAATSQAPG